MDFLDPKKKKKHATKLFAGYFLIAVAILIGSMILLFRTYGYDLDRKTGKVIQNGLIFLSAQPETATAYLNNIDKGKTDTRLTVPAGQYSVVLKRDGYRDWKKTISLEGGSIERLVYPLLVPEKLVTEDLQLYGQAPALATSSPDRHWLLVLQPNTIDRFDVFDMNNPDKDPVNFTLPSGLLSASVGANSLTVVEWSSDNRRVLMRHDYAGASEFIVVDREVPAESVNINKSFSTNPTSVSLRDKHFDQYYFYDQGAKTLQRAELKTKLITPYLNQVLNYKSYGNNIVLYISENLNLPGKVSVNLRDGDKNFELRTLASGDEYLLDLTQFDRSWYIAVGAKADGRIYVYKDPQSALSGSEQKALVPATVLKIDKPTHLSFSHNARFISAQNGAEFAVYDSETDRRLYYTLEPTTAGVPKAEWMDGHRLSLEYNNHALIFDFDGLNQQALSPSQPGMKIFFDRDYTGLYNVAPSTSVPGVYAVTRTDMKVK